MAKKNTGTTTTPDAPPFATKDGRPATPPSPPRGQDFTRSATSDAQRAERTPGRDFTKDAASQVPAPVVRDPMASAWPQQPGSPEREDVPPDGWYPPALPGAAARAMHADPGPQPARSPFKNLK